MVDAQEALQMMLLSVLLPLKYWVWVEP